MRHELARQVGSYHADVELLKPEVEPHRLHRPFQPAVGAEVPLARGKQQPPCGVLETEHHDGNHRCHAKNAEEHLAEHLKVSAKRQQLIISLAHRSPLAQPRPSLAGERLG